ncbi:MAG: FecR domain-containing protein, partial [Proteobacteria bacterium]|nr:FecR domain-containing protein [Burkholderiales bacterium]
SGAAVAIDAGGTPRPLAEDAALFNGETIRTAAASSAVIAFRDRSVITVIAASEMRIDDVRLRAQQPDQESFVVRLLTGGLRILTGQIAARSPRAVRFQTTTATIGVRGTGLDLRLGQHCVGTVCTELSTYVSVWDRSIVFIADAVELEVPVDRSAVFNPSLKQVQILDAIPAFFTGEAATRPDQLKIDFDRLFALTTFNDAPPGLYVGVRDGNVSLLGPDGVIDLGPLESGFLGDGSGRPVRFDNLPAFLFNDPFPTPDIPGSKVRVLPLIGLGSEAGSTACEVR